MPSEKVFKVATLQDFGYPAVSLFAEMHSNRLYLFLVSDVEGKYGVIPITQENLKEYMGGEVGLQDLTSGGFYEGRIIDGKAVIYPFTAPSCNETIALYGDFDEELYHDDIRMLSFMYDVSHHYPIEVR